MNRWDKLAQLLDGFAEAAEKTADYWMGKGPAFKDMYRWEEGRAIAYRIAAKGVRDFNF